MHSSRSSDIWSILAGAVVISITFFGFFVFLIFPHNTALLFTIAILNTAALLVVFAIYWFCFL